MQLRKALVASVRKKCSDKLSVKVKHFIKTPVRDTSIHRSLHRSAWLFWKTAL